MQKSSIHFKNIKNTSQSHNLRLRDFDYVRKDLSHLNKSYGAMTPHPVIIDELKTIIKDKTGRKAQAKAKVLIEGVFLIKKEHKNEKILNVTRNFSTKFKVNVLELHIHRDEGHYDKKTNLWKPNYHAHLVVENINRNTGKSIKWNRKDLSQIQDFFAEELEMERGKKSDRKHLSAIEYKIKKELEYLEEIIRKQKKINIKEAATLQGLIFADYYDSKLTLEEQHKYYIFLKAHRYGELFLEKSQMKKKTAIISKPLNNKNKRGLKR